MLASTKIGSDKLSDSMRDVFGEVAVFFAAMTKAISTTIDPIRTRLIHSTTTMRSRM
jgi:hypothetical protein